MKSITYTITVCNEEKEINTLLFNLLENKREVDDIRVLLDIGKAPDTLYNYLRLLEDTGSIELLVDTFGLDFSEWKNKLNTGCKGDWIVNLDADENLTPTLIKYLPVIAEQCEAKDLDCVVFSRLNTVEGITAEDIKKWGWHQTEEGYINFPDYQYRMYRNIPEIKWKGKVHERIQGFKNFTVLPHNPELCIIHTKSIQKQREQNNFYNIL